MGGVVRVQFTQPLDRKTGVLFPCSPNIHYSSLIMHLRPLLSPSPGIAPPPPFIRQQPLTTRACLYRLSPPQCVTRSRFIPSFHNPSLHAAGPDMARSGEQARSHLYQTGLQPEPAPPLAALIAGDCSSVHSYLPHPLPPSPRLHHQHPPPSSGTVSGCFRPPPASSAAGLRSGVCPWTPLYYHMMRGAVGMSQRSTLPETSSCVMAKKIKGVKEEKREFGGVVMVEMWTFPP